MQSRELSGACDFKDRSAPVRASQRGDSVKVPVCGLDQRAFRQIPVWTARRVAEGIERGQNSGSRNLEDCCVGRTVQKSVGPLNHSRERILSVWTERLAAKTIEDAESPARGNFENIAVSIRPAGVRRPVEVSIGCLHEGAVREFAVITIDLRAEAVQSSYRPSRSDFVNRAEVVRSAIIRGAVEVSVGALNQSAKTRISSVRAIETSQRSKCLGTS